jgi:hypothetical protein
MTTPNSLVTTMRLTESIKATGLKQEAINIANSANRTLVLEKDTLKIELEAAKAALARANALVADWQSAMEAWKDLAVTLREEIKSCPNHEAHKFGKDGKKINNQFHDKEDSERRKRGLKPKYTPA